MINEINVMESILRTMYNCHLDFNAIIIILLLLNYLIANICQLQKSMLQIKELLRIKHQRYIIYTYLDRAFPKNGIENLCGIRSIKALNGLLFPRGTTPSWR